MEIYNLKLNIKLKEINKNKYFLNKIINLIFLNIESEDIISLIQK